MKKRFQFFLFLIFFSTTVSVGGIFGQEEALNFDYLVQFDSEKNGQKFVEKMQRLRADYRASIFTRHIPIAGLFAPEMDMDQLEELLRNTEGVVAFQTNKVLEERATIPNDPKYFTDQWNMNIIMAPQAWDFSTGGITPGGDEIVVAIADNGFEIQHPDLVDNLFVNKFEIPGNNIDDDLNGYIDDVHGANLVKDNGDHKVENHGTGVMGIVGAKGNNGIGMTGVNWNVKLLPLSNAFLLESLLFKAYDYVATMRALFNSTNGAEGAFIVATNISGGRSNEFAKDAPIWCNWYDILGSHGVLNVGATANSNVDVDVVGDLPSACPSDYLIMVTNTTHLDVKAANAGYGVVSVDLGAPGDGNISTNKDLEYSGFSSTSCATPHVTGAIALMYSIPGTGIETLYKSDPAAAASAVKRAILDGVTPLNSLNGKTSTGGRLNLFNMIVKFSDSTKPISSPNFQAWPNPVNEMLTLGLPQSISSDVMVDVFDTKGVRVYSGIHRSNGATGNIHLQVAHLNPGAYLCRLTTSASTGMVRFIKI